MPHNNNGGSEPASQYYMMDSFYRIVTVFRSKILLWNSGPYCSLMIITGGQDQS